MEVSRVGGEDEAAFINWKYEGILQQEYHVALKMVFFN